MPIGILNKRTKRVKDKYAGQKYDEIFSTILNIPMRVIYIQGEILLDKHQQGQQKRQNRKI